MLLIPVFFRVQSGISAVSSPHPHTQIHTHTRVWHQHPSACPWLPPSLSSWQSLWMGWEHTHTHRFFSRVVLQGTKPVSADGHSWEGLVSLGDIEKEVCVCFWNPCPKSWLHASPVFTPSISFCLTPFTSSSVLFYPRLSYSLFSPPHHPVVFTPWRICKPVTHCPSPHQLCQHLFNDGSRSEAKLGQQLTGCLWAHAVRLECGLIFTYKAAYTLKF